MTQIVELRTLAHARAGDKGNRSNVSVFAYDPKDFGLLEAQVLNRDLNFTSDTCYRVAFNGLYFQSSMVSTW